MGGILEAIFNWLSNICMFIFAHYPVLVVVILAVLVNLFVLRCLFGLFAHLIAWLEGDDLNKNFDYAVRRAVATVESGTYAAKKLEDLAPKRNKEDKRVVNGQEVQVQTEPLCEDRFGFWTEAEQKFGDYFFRYLASMFVTPKGYSIIKTIVIIASIVAVVVVMFKK